jgi:hypothetical protein
LEHKSFFSLKKIAAPPYTSFFSGRSLFSGAVAGGGTTAPEFQNSSKLEKNYVLQILFSSSIHFSNYFSKKSNDATQILQLKFWKKRFTGREERERIHCFSPLCYRTLKLRFEFAFAPFHVFPLLISVLLLI